MVTMHRTITTAALAAILAVAPFVAPFTVAAQPSLPDPVLVPGDVVDDTYGVGSFNYSLNLIESPPPATTDARGVLITSNATGAQPLKGLPGSILGNTDRGESSSRAQGLVTVGDVRPVPASQGINIGAGPSQYALEDPRGQPPTAVTDPESVSPTVDPNVLITPVDDFVG